MAAGVELATAYFSLVPSMDGVAGHVKSGLGDPAIDKASEDAGKRFHRDRVTVADNRQR